VNIVLNQIIFQIINFSIILFVLVKFLYKPILKILAQRSQKIEDGVKAAEKNVKDQEEMDENVKSELNKARKDADKITKDSQKSADAEATEIIAKAKLDAKKVLGKERQAMEASLDQEKKRLEGDFVQMVTQTSEELLQKYLTKKDQQQIISSQIKELKSIKFN